MATLISFRAALPLAVLLTAAAGLTGCDRDMATGKKTSLVHLPRKAPAALPDPSSGPTMADMANADNPPDQATPVTDPRYLAGTFEGTLPCPDCTAVVVDFSLRADGTFRRVDKPVGGKLDGRAVTSAGRWRLAGDGRTIEAGLDRPEAMVTLAIEGRDQLRMLDVYGRRIEGADSERYVLRRQAPAGSAATIPAA